MGRGFDMMCWRRLHEWHNAGVWDRPFQTLLDELGEADQIAWERTCVDSDANGQRRFMRPRRMISRDAIATCHATT